MSNPALTVPGALRALLALGESTRGRGVSDRTLELVNLRVSQINGCAVCVDMHARDLKSAGESDERLFALAAWRDAPWFDDAERAALALAESATRIADRGEGVPDDVWDAAREQYDEDALAALVLAIANINVWNRLNAATRQVAGSVHA